MYICNNTYTEWAMGKNIEAINDVAEAISNRVQKGTLYASFPLLTNEEASEIFPVVPSAMSQPVYATSESNMDLVKQGSYLLRRSEAASALFYRISSLPLHLQYTGASKRNTTIGINMKAPRTRSSFGFGRSAY